MTTTLAVPCPLCQAEQEIPVEARYLPGLKASFEQPPEVESFEDARAVEMPATCWHCTTPLTNDLPFCKAVAAAIDGLTLEDFR